MQVTEYPWEGEVILEVHPDRPLEFILAVRIPSWCRDPRLRVNGDEVDLMTLVDKGYAKIQRRWHKGDKLELLLPMAIERVYAHPRSTAGSW